jgi:hypothetical protein
MATEYPTTAKIIDTIIALDAIMPSVLDILARQDPEQRDAVNAALTYAIYRLNNESLKADMKGVTDILSSWQRHIMPGPVALNI